LVVCSDAMPDVMAPPAVVIPGWLLDELALAGLGSTVIGTAAPSVIEPAAADITDWLLAKPTAAALLALPAVSLPGTPVAGADSIAFPDPGVGGRLPAKPTMLPGGMGVAATTVALPAAGKRLPGTPTNR